MDRYYNGLIYESLPSEDRPVKYVYLGQKTHEYTFIDESIDFEYFMNNDCYNEMSNVERSKETR